jgi:hypothetical protein
MVNYRSFAENSTRFFRMHLFQVQGRPEAAYDSDRTALSIIDGVAARLSDQVLRKSFLNSDHVQVLQMKMDQARR